MSTSTYTTTTPTTPNPPQKTSPTRKMRTITYLIIAFLTIFIFTAAVRRITWAFYDIINTVSSNLHHQSYENQRFAPVYRGERYGAPYGSDCLEIWSECTNICPGYYRPDSVEYRSWTYGCDAMRSLCTAAKSGSASRYE